MKTIDELWYGSISPFEQCTRGDKRLKELLKLVARNREELYRGEKYDIMSAVTAKALQLGIDERTEEGRTWIEMELVRQTVIAIEQMKKNGDCIAEGELGVRSPFPYAEDGNEND